MTTSAIAGPHHIQPSGGAPLRRVAALARAELLLLRRTPMAMITALIMPITMVLLFRVAVPPELAADTGATGSFLVIALTGSTLLLVVYSNLVTAMVARREELVLKRLRCGELSDTEILIGSVVPGVLVAWTQIGAALVTAVVVFDMPAATNPLLAAAGITAGTAVLVLLALTSAGITRSVQFAELTTTPLLVASLALGGFMMPLHIYPDVLQHVGRLMPLTPAIDLVRLGLAGTTPDGRVVGAADLVTAAGAPMAILAAWLVVGAWATRRSFRWEPRR